MEYNKNTFIVPINNDTILKLRDTTGNIVAYIKVPECTVAVSGNDVLVKQQSESKPIILNFDNKSSAIYAQKKLREALLLLKENLEGYNAISYYLHVQDTPSDNWMIYHALGKYTHVTIYDENEIIIVGNVQKLSPNGVRILFNKPTIGKALIS